MVPLALMHRQNAHASVKLGGEFMKLMSALLSAATLVQLAFVPQAAFSQNVVADLSGAPTQTIVQPTSSELGAPVLIKSESQCCPQQPIIRKRIKVVPAVLADPCCRTQPAVIEHRRNWLLPALVAAAVVATAITLPIALTRHHHSNNGRALLLRQALLTPTPV